MEHLSFGLVTAENLIIKNPILDKEHPLGAASRAKRVLFIKDGILYNQIFRGDKTERQMFQEISDTLTVMASEVGNYVQTNE